jgi:hypothetical protein
VNLRAAEDVRTGVERIVAVGDIHGHGSNCLNNC